MVSDKGNYLITQKQIAMTRTQHIFTSLFLSFSLLFSSQETMAQCAPLESALPALTMSASAGGTQNRCGMVYNPVAKLYYAVNAGLSTYPADTYDENGMLLASPSQGFDYRGAWWNPALNTFEGNGFNDLGIFIQTLEAGTSYPSGSGTVVFTSNQPDLQSVGDLDYDANEIIYYFNGFIHRYSRINNGLLGTYAVQGLPVGTSSINSNTVVYTGCPGYEIGLYDFENLRMLFINKSTGMYSGLSQLPPDAPARTSFGVSYANDLFWLFSAGEWRSYEVLSPSTNSSDVALEQAVQVFPNPVVDRLQVQISSDQLPQSLQLFTMQGQLLQHETIATSQQGIELPMGHLPSGVYLVKIQFEQGAVVRKVVK